MAVSIFCSLTSPATSRTPEYRLFYLSVYRLLPNERIQHSDALPTAISLAALIAENVALDAGNVIGYADQAPSEIKYFAMKGLLSPLNKQPKT